MDLPKAGVLALALCCVAKRSGCVKRTIIGANIISQHQSCFIRNKPIVQSYFFTSLWTMVLTVYSLKFNFYKSLDNVNPYLLVSHAAEHMEDVDNASFCMLYDTWKMKTKKRLL